MINEYEQYLLSMPADNYLLYRDELKANERRKNYAFTDINLKHSSIGLEEISSRLFEFKETLSKTGRLNYKLLPFGCKKELDNFVDLIISSNEKFERTIANFVSSKLDIAELYTSDPKKLFDKEIAYKKEAKEIIGNIVLRAIKEININENKLAYDIGRQKFETEELLKSILFFLSDLVDRNHSTASHSQHHGGMSKEAKKEFMHDLRDRGIGVER